VSNVFLVRYPESPLRVPDKGTVNIGRADSNDIVLNEPRVSRQHAAIGWDKAMDSFLISDLGSKNGTYLNGFKITMDDPRPISDWNKIRITSIVFTVRCVDDSSIIKNEFEQLREKMHQDVTEIINMSDLMAEAELPGISGDLEHLCPVELFQMLESGRKTGSLTLKTSSGEGAYLFEKGNVVTARFAQKSGDKAVFEVLRFNNGTFSFSPLEKINERPQISSTTTMLLMEGCRIMDEEHKGSLA
jgi:pSer/pThr/pTyr-binding forkhead associated (FHA) protein